MFWEIQAITGGAPVFSALWGIPFVVIGLYFIVGRFIYKKRRKLTTVYGLTGSRAIVSSSERSFNDMPLVGTPRRINRSRDGRHVSVAFGATGQTAYQNTGLDFFNIGQAAGIAFYDVADPDAFIHALDTAQYLSSNKVVSAKLVSPQRGGNPETVKGPRIQLSIMSGADLAGEGQGLCGQSGRRHR